MRLDLLQEDVFGWVGAVGCEFAIEVLTGAPPRLLIELAVDFLLAGREDFDNVVAAATAAGVVNLATAEVAIRVDEPSPECGELFFHYTSLAELELILTSGVLIASEEFRSRTAFFEAGVYATTIPPLPPMTQTELADHIRPGKNVSWFVALCSNNNPEFTGLNVPPQFGDFRVARRFAGELLPVVIEFVGPNLMQ